MAKLLKVDLKRLFKDKLLLVVAIIGVVLALTTPLIYKFIYLFIGADDTGLLGSLLSIKTMFYSSFSLFFRYLTQGKDLVFVFFHLGYPRHSRGCTASSAILVPNIAKRHCLHFLGDSKHLCKITVFLIFCKRLAR